jgi:hypothetical protein
MAFVTTFVNRGRCALQIGSGVVSGSEMVAGARAVRAHVQSGAELTHGLVDLSDVSELHLTAEEVELIAVENHIAAASMPHGTVAVIATKDLAFGMARMWEAMVSGTNWHTRVFRDAEAARAWLHSDTDTGEHAAL